MAVNFNSEHLQKHKPLSDAIKDSLTAEGSSIKEKESHGAYFANVPEELGITPQQIEDLSKYNNRFVTAAHVAIGEMAGDMFNNDSSLNRVDAKVGFFGKRDEVEITVHREKVYRNNFAENEEDKELRKPLVMSTTISSAGYGLKSVRDAMSEEFKDRFVK